MFWRRQNFLEQAAASRCERFPTLLVVWENQNTSNTLKMGTESVPETSENLHIFTRLYARENFIDIYLLLTF